MKVGFKGFTITENIVSDGRQGAVHIEPGPYLVEVATVKPSPEDLPEEKTTYVEFGLKILAGAEGIGRKLRHYVYLSEAAQFQLGNVLLFTGNKKTMEKLAKDAPDIDTYEEFVEFVEVIAKKTTGKKFGVEVADDSYNGNPRSKVMELFDAAEFPDRFGVGTSPQDQEIEAAEDEIEEPEEDEEEEEAPPPPKKKKAAPAPVQTAAIGSAKSRKKPAASVEDELARVLRGL